MEQDFTKRKIEKEELQDHFLHTVLVCPAYPSQKFKQGTHLDHWPVKMAKQQHYSNIKSNMHKRYHHLKEDKKIGVPDLILDFKHYYAIHMDVLYKLYAEHFFAHINCLFREDLSHRFSFYLSRVGLPDIVSSDKSKQAQPTNAD